MNTLGCQMPCCKLTGECTQFCVMDRRSETGGTDQPEEWVEDVDYANPRGPYYDRESWEISCDIATQRAFEVDCPQRRKIVHHLESLTEKKRNDGTVYEFYGDKREYCW